MRLVISELKEAHMKRAQLVGALMVVAVVSLAAQAPGVTYVPAEKVRRCLPKADRSPLRRA